MNKIVKQNIYFLGIGGIGMSALARYFYQKGCVVTGYDKTPSPLTKKLEEEKKSSLPSMEELFEKYTGEGLRGKEITNRVAEELGLPKRQVYDEYLKLYKRQG